MRQVWRRLPEGTFGPAAQGLLLLGALLAALLFPKWSLATHQVIKGGDGGYYTNVAMHVQQGHGLKTNLSLMHKGYAYFPHPSAVYPLWPLVQGYAARVIGLHAAGVWLPTLFYFVTLVLGYLWAATLLPSPLFPRALPGFNAGHILALIFGLNKEFFWFTSLPYTEGLAYALLFAGLLRGHAILQEPTVRGGLELGFWSGLIFLTRTQLVIFQFALLATAVWAVAAVPERRYAGVKLGVAATLAFFAVATPYYLYVKSFAVEASFGSLLRFDQIRGTDALTPIDPLVRAETLWGYVKDRLSGFPIAFHWLGTYAYARQFFTFQYALLLGAPFALGWLLSRTNRTSVKAFWRWLRSPECLPVLFVAALAVGGFLSIHIVHKAMWSEWNFHIRHALTCAPLFCFALVFLLRSRWTAAFLAGLLVLTSGTYAGYDSAQAMVDRAKRRSDASEFRPGLVAWINEQRSIDDELILVSRFVQHIWHYTPDVNYHSYFDSTSIYDLIKMFDRLHADFLIVPTAIIPDFMSNQIVFARHFKLVETISSCHIFERRRQEESRTLHRAGAPP